MMLAFTAPLRLRRTEELFFPTNHLVSSPTVNTTSTPDQSEFEVTMSSPQLAAIPSMFSSYFTSMWNRNTPKLSRSNVDLLHVHSSVLPKNNSYIDVCHEKFNNNNSNRRLCAFPDSIGFNKAFKMEDRKPFVSSFPVKKTVIPTLIKSLVAETIIDTMKKSHPDETVIMQGANLTSAAEFATQETLCSVSDDQSAAASSVDSTLCLLISGDNEMGSSQDSVGYSPTANDDCSDSYLKCSQDCKEMEYLTTPEKCCSLKEISNVGSESLSGKMNNSQMNTHPECNELSESSFSDSGDALPVVMAETSIISEDVTELKNVCGENDSTTCPVKFLKDLTSVLFDRTKKCTKKGRPSSKKQKKRRREKSKHSDKKMSTGESISDSCWKIPECLSTPFSESVSAGLTAPCKDESESQGKSFAARFFFIGSEDSSTCSSDSEDAKFSDDDDDWADDQEETECLSPHISIFFGMGAPKDNVSKTKHIPVVNSCSLQVDTGFPEVKSFDDSDEFLWSPTSFSEEHHVTIFSPHLRERLGSDEAEEDDDEELAEDYYLDIQEVNARWNSHYPSPCDGCRSIEGSSTSTGCCSAVKIHFAADSVLETVHIIGNEDRRGEWMAYAVDRERFGRLIQQCGDVISPVLSQSHRAKMFERNKQLQKMMD